MKKVTCEVFCSHSPSVAAECHQLSTILLQQMKNIWAPPVFIPLPPWGTGRRRRWMPPLVLMKRYWFRSLFSRFTVKTVHICDCCSEVWSEFHRCISARFVQRDISLSISLALLRGWATGEIFLCQLVHLDALLLGPANFELRITIFWISLEAIVNSFKILFDTSLPRVVGHEMLFLCLGFAVPSTTRSHLSDDVVRDGENIQSPLTKHVTGFAFNQVMSTSATDPSLIPI